MLCKLVRAAAAGLLLLLRHCGAQRQLAVLDEDTALQLRLKALSYTMNAAAPVLEVPAAAHAAAVGLPVISSTRPCWFSCGGPTDMMCTMPGGSQFAVHPPQLLTWQTWPPGHDFARHGFLGPLQL
jgi:hypothetical protein